MSRLIRLVGRSFLLTRFGALPSSWRNVLADRREPGQESLLRVRAALWERAVCATREYAGYEGLGLAQVTLTVEPGIPPVEEVMTERHHLFRLPFSKDGPVFPEF